MRKKPLSIAIIGAGLGGLCMGKRLLDEGFEDFIILERADDIGGTWYANRYPGCECDTTAILYSYSFEPNRKWSKILPTQSEILDYLKMVADKYNLRSHIRLSCPVKRMKWRENNSTWVVTLESGEIIKADVVISAIGLFNQPHWPNIKGLDKFKGAIWHTAQWNADHDLAGEKVAVIGTGSTAVQLVPEIVKKVEKLYLFQRTANWVIPRNDIPDSQTEYKKFLANNKLYRETRDKIERYINVYVNQSDPNLLASYQAMALAALEVVKDTRLRQKLHPNFPIGRKRIIPSNTYYPAFNLPNLELVAKPINQIDDQSITTVDNRKLLVDTIILATGFETPKYLLSIEVTGKDGLDITYAWRNGPRAYLGIMTTGFPNLFMLFGPNTYTGSVPIMIEAQVEYVIRHLHHLAEDNISSVDVKPVVMQRYDNEVQAAFMGVVPREVNHDTDYRIWSINNDMLWPFSIDNYRQRTASIEPKAFTTSKTGNKRK